MTIPALSPPARLRASPDDEYLLDFLKACRKFRDRLRHIIDHYDAIAPAPYNAERHHRTRAAAEAMRRAIDGKILKGKRY